MGRLTDRDKHEQGIWVDEQNELYDFHKFVEPSDVLYPAINKLAHYEDLEEQGRMIEQKHGQWISLDSYVYECDGMWECSECGEDFYFEFGTPLECRAYYCPNCGAKMELKGE